MSNRPNDRRERFATTPSREDIGEYVDPEELPEYVAFQAKEGEDEHELHEEAPGEDVSDDLLLEDVDRADSWLHFNKGLEQTGYAPTEALTPDNIDQLEREYVIETDSAGMQTTTTIVPGDPPVMYFYQNESVVKAANARTGEVYWRFQYGYPEDVDYTISPRHRGVAVHGDKVYIGTANLHFVALDRYTGEKVLDENTKPPQLEEDLEFPFIGYAYSPAPVYYDGLVYMGQVGGDASLLGHTFAQAINPETGEIEWQTRNAPKDEWIGETWKMANGSNWMSPSIDRETDTVFWNTGNPRPMLNPLARPGPNQMTAGIVAYDAKSGEVKWNDQMSPGDIWDYDGQFVATVMTAEVEGEERRVVVADHKNGWSYTYDVETGQLLSRSVPFAEQSEDHHGFIGHGEENASEIWPAAPGGTEYPADGLSPKTGYRYVGSNDFGNLMWMHEWEPDFEEGIGYGPEGEEDITGGVSEDLPGLGEDVEFSAHVTAVDVRTGDHAWRTEIPDVDPSWSPFRLYLGGTTPTGGNLVFNGSSGGHLYALDAEDGEILWEDDTGERIQATPVVWEDPGEDAVFVSVPSSDRVVVYRADVGLD